MNHAKVSDFSEGERVEFYPPSTDSSEHYDAEVVKVTEKRVRIKYRADTGCGPIEVVRSVSAKRLVRGQGRLVQ